MIRSSRLTWLLVALSLLLALFLLSPILSLVGLSSPSSLVRTIGQPDTQAALGLSLISTCCAVAVIVLLGTPLAYFLSQSVSAASRWLHLFLQLPLVLPPAVAGVALLSVFGSRGLLARWGLLGEGNIAFTQLAVVVAEIFVAGPLYLRAASSAFSSLDQDLIAVARTMGASPARVLFRVCIPLSRGGLRAAVGLSAARALGEFGATLMFAGNLPGVTQTMPLSIYTALEGDFKEAQAQSVLLLLLSVGLLAGSQWLGPPSKEDSRRTVRSTARGLP